MQDEDLFGRMSDPVRCWAPAPCRPAASAALVREYRHVFGSVCPKTGHLDYMSADNMKTDNMSAFLRRASRARPNHFAAMAVDGASSHKAKSLKMPANASLIVLPPCSPELNPAERIWNMIRKQYFGNRCFDS